MQLQRNAHGQVTIDEQLSKGCTNADLRKIVNLWIILEKPTFFILRQNNLELIVCASFVLLEESWTTFWIFDSRMLSTSCTSFFDSQSSTAESLRISSEGTCYSQITYTRFSSCGGSTGDIILGDLRFSFGNSMPFFCSSLGT